MRLWSYSIVATAALMLAEASVPLVETFREPKNIAFGATVGGSSHIVWPLLILEEMGKRGHNISFITKDDTVRFGKPFRDLDTISIGPGIALDRASLTTNPGFVKRSLGKKLLSIYPKDFKATVDFLREKQVDLVVCDHFMDVCIDAAISQGIPYVVTMSLDYTKESAAPYINNHVMTINDPTTQYQSIMKRFKNKFVLPSLLTYYQREYKAEANKVRATVGAPLLSEPEKLKDAMKLINNVIGMAPARPIGSLSEWIGPILPKHYQPLTDDIKTYLDSHKRIAYVAFGQQVMPSSQNIEFILTGLLEAYEAGVLDGFIWAAVGAEDRFPEEIKTKKGTVYNKKDIFEGRSVGRIVDWAPQTAVLHHPSTYLFVSHGGVTSWQESMYAGVRMIMFPFFADQPGNALTIERNKLGGILKKDATLEKAIDLFHCVAADPDGEITKNIIRFQALVQVRSRNAVQRGADVLEEVMFVQADGKIPHRFPPSHNMPFIKAHNIDIYLLFILLVLLVLSVVYKSSVLVFRWLSRSKKVKTI
ncbi:MAG: hypothetical protein EXX96DRAFT_584046 [Benjaminiella poitrasii]|nr:MAG: hypothetical protein EXX96DRAFT_584046 [Benjaminiella poitrasii]